MNEMKNNDSMNDGASDNKGEERLFTKAVRGGKIEYIEREVDKFNFDGFDVVRKEWFSKVICPAITFKYGSLVLNVRAIRKLGNCSHIHFLMNMSQKLLIVKPCKEDDKDAQQCSRVDKRGEVVPRAITCKGFAAKLYQDMNWNPEGTYKMLGTLLKSKDTNESIFAFELKNAEAYLRVSEPTDDDPKRRIRVQMPEPEHWKISYGQTYEDSQKPIVESFEDMPNGFVKITFPKLPFPKPVGNEENEKEVENGTA